ncbi:MAG: hypothetical protein NT049_11805 [Planctomycetota bacterium]|nr:hypothetical protein [Planctomycetota bacterium]
MPRNRKSVILAACVLAVLLSYVSVQAAEEKNLRDVIGVTHVAGKYHLTEKDFLNEGADQILALGSRVIKLYLAKPARDYPFNTQWPETKSLVEMAQTAPYVALFKKPFTTYIMTTYSVGRGDHYWRTGISEADKADETRQFRELAKHFLTTYRGTGKTFVLQHWEGDWAIRPRTDPKLDPTPQAIEGMIAWLSARQEGVNQARAEAGEQGVHVYHAPEVNLVVQSMRDGRPGVVNQVLPKTKVDLVSYSAWDGQGDAKTLRAALDFIAKNTPPSKAFGSKNVYLGEFGKPENDSSPAKVEQTIRTAVETGLDWGCPYIVYWQVYCNEAKTTPVKANADVRGFWLIRPDGTRTVAWDYFSGLLAGKAK